MSIVWVWVCDRIKEEGRSFPELSRCLRRMKTTEVLVSRINIYIPWAEVYSY